MSTIAASTFNITLTNYAQGVAQDRRSAIADFLAPQVPVGAASGQYKRFNSKNAFVIYDTARAIGGKATRIEFDADDPTFNCKPQGLEIVIDDHERDLAGVGDPLRLEQAKIDTLIGCNVAGHEVKVCAAVKAAIPAVSGVGEWSKAENDPVAELDAQIMAIAIATGQMPNAMTIGIGAWNLVRNHPKVVARQPGAALIGLTLVQFASMLLNPSIEIKVAILSKDLAKLGNAKNAANIFGNEVIVFLRSATPTQFDPSMAKTFTIGEGLVGGVRQYREEPFNDVYLLEWSEDIEVTSTESARRMAIS